VTIYEFELVNVDTERRGERPFAPTVNIRVRIHCSSGTYIRALARDLGHELGTGGYVSELRRTAIGEFRVENAEKL
jgi:tRNA pseudouridine55 synthase